MKDKIAKIILWVFGLLVAAFLFIYIMAIAVSAGASVAVAIIAACATFFFLAMLAWAMEQV